MARELSQEAVLDFLWGAGGSAPNAALLRHFERFLRDPALSAEQQRQRRDRFKRLVNSVATVRAAAAPGASKDIVLRRRYRDLLGEEQLRPRDPHARDGQHEEKEPPLEPPQLRDRPRQGRRSPPGEAAGQGQGRPSWGQPPCTARGGLCCECRRARRTAPAPELVPVPDPSQLPFAKPPPYRARPPPGSAEPPPPQCLPPPSGHQEPPPYKSLVPLSGPREPPASCSRPPPSRGLTPPSGAREPLPPQCLRASGPKESPPSQSLTTPAGLGAPSPAQSLLRPSGPKQSAPTRALPSSSSGHQETPPSHSLLPQSVPKEPPPSRSLPLSSGHQEPPPSWSLPLSSGHRETPPIQSLPLQSGPKEPPPSQSPLLPGLRHREPPPSQSLTPPPCPRKLPPSRSLPPPSGPQEPPPSQSLPPPLGSKEQPPLQSLQSLSGPRKPPQSQSLLPPAGARALPSIGLPRSLPLSLAGPPPYRARPPPGIKGPPPSQCLLPPEGPGVLPSNGLPHSQSPPKSVGPEVLSPTEPLRFQSQSQSLLAAPVQGSPEHSPLVTVPVFRSIRRQLASLEAQDTPPPPPEEVRELPHVLAPANPPRNTHGRAPAVPLGRREHAWLVAVSDGRWAHVRALFWEEPQLALWRDFMSGFTALHWLAKHGDVQGLRELAEAAREAGLALDVDARSGCGYTPLHLAAMHGHQPAVKVLVLQLGCRVRIRDSSGRQPWEYLGSSTSGEIWQLLEAPRGKVIFATQPLARSVSSASRATLPAGRASLATCLKPQRGLRAAPRRPGGDSD